MSDDKKFPPPYTVAPSEVEQTGENSGSPSVPTSSGPRSSSTQRSSVSPRGRKPLPDVAEPNDNTLSNKSTKINVAVNGISTNVVLNKCKSDPQSPQIPAVPDPVEKMDPAPIVKTPPAVLKETKTVASVPEIKRTYEVTATSGGNNPQVGMCQFGHSFVTSYSCCAIVLAIVFFPIGIACCIGMRKRQCLTCGAKF